MIRSCHTRECYSPFLLIFPLRCFCEKSIYYCIGVTRLDDRIFFRVHDWERDDRERLYISCLHLVYIGNDA